MPVTRNVAWDGQLESFKGRDTTNYVVAAAAVATTCSVCGGPLVAGQPMSLVVDVAESVTPDGAQCLIFNDWVCHRRCGDPGLQVHRTDWKPEYLSPLAVRVILAQRTGTGEEKTVAALAYTVVPVVAFREDGGELTSALVTVLLSHGFGLAMSADYGDILDEAPEADDACRVTVAHDGLVTFDVDGQTIYREQLDPQSADDARWVQSAARSGSVLVISGDNLVISGTSLDLGYAAQVGTLAIGTVALQRV